MRSHDLQDSAVLARGESLRTNEEACEVARGIEAKVVTFHHIESNPFSAFRSHPVFGIWEPVRFRHLQAS